MKPRKEIISCERCGNMTDVSPCTPCKQALAAPQHTPTPWSIDALGYLRGPESENILEVKDNAAFIVRAVNNHEILIGTLQGILMAIEDDVFDGKRAREVIEMALAKAEGK